MSATIEWLHAQDTNARILRAGAEAPDWQNVTAPAALLLDSPGNCNGAAVEGTPEQLLEMLDQARADLLAQHPSLAPYEPAMCGDEDPDSDYECSLDPAHAGDHVALDGPGGKVLAEWPREDDDEYDHSRAKEDARNGVDVDDHLRTVTASAGLGVMEHVLDVVRDRENVPADTLLAVNEDDVTFLYRQHVGPAVDGIERSLTTDW